MSEPTNADRAARALKTLKAYGKLTGTVDRMGNFNYAEDSVLSDLLADLRHLCADEKFDFDRANRIGQDIFQDEQYDESPEALAIRAD